MELTEANTPWLRCRGEPYQVISSLELLATLYAVKVFWPEDDCHGDIMTTTGTAVTDNIGNSYVVGKLMTTKFPLCALLMELAEQLGSRGSWLRLQWAPRDQNQEADALTNGDFHQFKPENRVEVDPGAMSWILLDEFLEAGGAMTDELARLRSEKKALREKMKMLKRSRKKRLAEDSLKVKHPW